MEAIVSFVVEQLGNLMKDEVGLSIDVKKEVEKLHSKFTAIRARLRKAEKQQFTDETVRDWLRKIKEVVYEVDNILDEWRTDASLSQRKKDDNGNQSMVGFLSFLPPFFKRRKLRHETRHCIREITERLDDISKEKSDLSFNEDVKIEEVGLMPDMKARETGSLIDESKIFGRDGDRESLINELVSETNPKQKSVSIISIVGMGGLGKTTLAQLACNDESVKTHFNEKIIWVYVSDPFDVKKIATEVIESMGRPYPKNPNLNTLQHSLREAVSKMPFLLVLDDVWNVDENLWKQLKVPLMGAAQGSKILVTTRSHKAAEVMETTHFHDLKHLSHSDCWELFKSIAFKGAEDEDVLALTKVGEEIVRRCEGLPLAVQAVGSLLGGRRTYEYWKHILDSRIWEWDVGILPSLLLSYYSLPFHLKRCFSFCSLFPKVYVRDELVKLWMAHGLIESNQADIEVDHLEEIGEMYIDDLLARSLFQEVKFNILGKNIYLCKMHDLVHDLATRVADGDYRYMENEDSPPTNCHHLSFLLNRDVSSIPSPLFEATRLRTLLLLSSQVERSKINAIPDSLFNHLRFLRALDVRETSIENLPSSISDLKHLRYLNLSFSMIKVLPESVTDLCNLLTLKLNSCERLCMLPSGMSKMVQLRHLEIEVTPNLTFLPNGLGNLSNLRTLSKFPVSDENRGCKIGELKNLNLLRGELMIENLERVLNVNEAREAQLNKKSYLQTLHFDYKIKTEEEWRMLGDGEMERMDGVFECLGPLHSNLKKLVIGNYLGSKFSSWLEDFQSLTEVRLWGCRKVRVLPNLGNLCSLKYLEIFRANEVKVVGDEFCGNGAGRGRVFPKLESLSFKQMENWEEWKLTDEYGEVMPSLKELTITRCNKLKALPDRLPCNLRKVTVEECEEVTWMPCDALPLLEFLSLGGHAKVELSPFPALKTFKIRFASYETLRSDGWELLESLHTIEIYRCPKLAFLPDGWELLESLHTIEISDCPRLAFLPDGMGKLKALQTLYINGCSQLTNLPEGLGQLETLHTLRINGCSGFTSLFNGLVQFKTLRHLDILGCNSLRSLSDGLVHFEVLQSLHVWCCPKLQSLFDGFEQLKSLRRVNIYNCPELKHFPPLQHLTTLEKLEISNCPLAKEQLQKEIREGRCNVSHICSIKIDGERIQ
ncbi:putative disease resistance protein RGA1 [Cinnamomum micranthum f. kanehirae]|uniref:Putative disease resistance protein RGA1 n=1 Tax=Cinnamomum micranthum f. kanehirae TaxID=337451 RepID=A0A443N532_9MAGN|nr:putative disease resistance protein RGA1 [Cinnamomum micranthum f. kanehirae]